MFFLFLQSLMDFYFYFHCLFYRWVVAERGLEPPTGWLQVSYSTSWITLANKLFFFTERIIKTKSKLLYEVFGASDESWTRIYTLEECHSTVISHLHNLYIIGVLLNFKLFLSPLFFNNSFYTYLFYYKNLFLFYYL